MLIFLINNLAKHRRGTGWLQQAETTRACVAVKTPHDVHNVHYAWGLQSKPEPECHIIFTYTAKLLGYRRRKPSFVSKLVAATLLSKVKPH